MHEMQTIATDDPVACMFVCRSDTRLLPAKTAKRIEVIFAMKTSEGPRNIKLDVGLDPPQWWEVTSMRPSPNYTVLDEYENLPMCADALHRVSLQLVQETPIWLAKVFTKCK